MLITTIALEEVEAALQGRNGRALLHCEPLFHDQFTGFRTAEFEFHHIGEAIALFSGRAFRNGLKIVPSHYASVQRLAEDLKEAIGFFSIVLIERDQLYLFESLYRHVDLYYGFKDEQVVVCSDLDWILTLLGPRRINQNYLFEFITEECSFGSETFFEDLFQVPLGELVSLRRHESPQRKAWNIPRPQSVDFIKELQQTISLFSDGEERIFIHFSGGLDSSLILHCAQKVGKECIALHLLSKEDPASEEHIARQVADELAATMRVYKPSIRFSDARTSFEMRGYVNNQFDVHPLSPEPSNRNYAYDEQMRSAGIKGGFFSDRAGRGLCVHPKSESLRGI